MECSDYQYMQSAQVDFANFLLNEFVYYYDQESGSLLPLCNKADCAHCHGRTARGHRACSSHPRKASRTNIIALSGSVLQAACGQN